jgi:RNA polymerase sigma-B factor
VEGRSPKRAAPAVQEPTPAGGNVTSATKVYDLSNIRKQGDFEKYLPLLRSRAKRFLYSGRDYDEIINAGAVGLGNAIERYRKGSNNGLAAFAIPHIDGAIRRFLKKSYYIVSGARTERGKHLPRTACVEHFGNVMVGDESYKPDVSLNAEISNDGEHGDDEEGGGTFLDQVVDHTLEGVTGDRWSRLEDRLNDRECRILRGKRRGLTNKEIGAELDISDEAVRQALGVITKKIRRQRFDLDRFAWLDHDAKLFRREIEEYLRKGIGHLYRGRQQPKMSRSLITHNKLYQVPAWTKHKKTGHCICLRCCPAKLWPSEFYAAHSAKIRTYERTAAGWAPKKKNSKPDPVLISVALGYAAAGAVKDKKSKARKGKPWLYTYNGKHGVKPSPRPKPKGLDLPRDPAPPRGERWKQIGSTRSYSRRISWAEYERIYGERKDTCKDQPSTHVSLCYSNADYSKPSAPQPVIATFARRPMSGRRSRRSSSGMV